MVCFTWICYFVLCINIMILIYSCVFFLCPSFQYGSRFLVSSLLFVDVSSIFPIFSKFCWLSFQLIELSVGPINYLLFVNRANSLVWCILSPWYAGNNWFVGFFCHLFGPQCQLLWKLIHLFGPVLKYTESSPIDTKKKNICS